MQRFLALLLVVALASPLSAQLVHLTFEGRAFEADGGDGWWRPGETHAVRIDVQFDARLPGVVEPGYYGHYYSIYPDRNYWRVRAGNVDVSMPLRLIDVRPEALKLQTFTGVDGDLVSMGAWIEFDGRLSPELALPVPPLPGVLDWDVVDEVPRSFLDLRTGGDFAWGAGRVIFVLDEGTAAIERPLTAVPEPAAYAAGGLVLMLGAVMVRRWKAQPAANPAEAGRRGGYSSIVSPIAGS